MNILLSIVIVGLLQQYCAVQGFTVQMAQDDITGFEGDTLRPMVRLEGQLNDEVEVLLELQTVSEFLSSSNAPADVTFNDAAEPADFDFDGTLTHTFEPVANIRQTTTFDIDIVNDDRNERVEDFVAVVTVTHVAHQFDSHQTSPNLRSFTTITILIDPNAPDRTQLRVSAQADEIVGGTVTVCEARTGWSLSLTIIAFPPENDIEISVVTQQTTGNPAMPFSDYNLLDTNVTLTQAVTSYSIVMEFIDDEIPEPAMEAVQVTFNVLSDDDTVTFEPAASITVSIEDDDSLTLGFSLPRLEIKEGSSAEVEVAILSPAVVDVGFTGRVTSIGSTGDEIPDDQSFTLSQGNRRYSFKIDIPDNDVIEMRERQYTLSIIIIDFDSEHYTINPKQLSVVVKDNDTAVNFGIIDGSSSVISIDEGSAITFTVGFLDDTLQLDDDFVVGFSVKILYADPDRTATSEDFVTTDIPDGILNNIIRRQEITIETKSNSEVQDDRNFTVVIQHISENSPLVKLQAGSAQAMSVVIVDNDIDRPNKPNVSVHHVSGDKEFEIEWSIVVTSKQPVDTYRIEISILGEGTAANVMKNITVTDSRETVETQEYKIDGVDYSTANISVRVCAINEQGETCSDTEFFRGIEPPAGRGSQDGISGGGIAAIIIMLIVFFFIIIIIILLVLLIRLYFWKNYYPIIREEKYGETREQLTDASAQSYII